MFNQTFQLSGFKRSKRSDKLDSEVILLCKDSKVEDLFDTLSQLSSNVLTPDKVDEEGHNAFYYAIRSGNVELLRTLIDKWPGNYFASNPDKLDEVLSKAYEELKLKNVLLSEEIEIFVQDKLVNLRFFKQKDPNTKPSLDDVKQRIDMVTENIELLIEKYSDVNSKVDEKFLYISRFIAQNLYVLKRLLKSTYDRLPWEEMEFYLVYFYGKNREIDSVYNVLLDKQKLLGHIAVFNNELKDVKEDLENKHIGSNLPKKLTRDEAISKILSKNSQLEGLYADYKQIKDIYSLARIKRYIDLIQGNIDNQDLNQLITERALQVTGEYLKNTLESPHMSEELSRLLLSSFHAEVKEIMVNLRDSLSHAFYTKLSAHERIYSFIFVDRARQLKLDLKGDLTRLQGKINDVLKDKRIEQVSTVLKKIADSENLDEMRVFSDFFSTLELDRIYDDYISIQPFSKVKNLIEKLKNLTQEYRNDEPVKSFLEQMDEAMLSVERKPLHQEMSNLQPYLKFLAFYIENGFNIASIKTLTTKILDDLKEKELGEEAREKIVQLVTKIHLNVKDKLTIDDLVELNALGYEFSYELELKVGRFHDIKQFEEELEAEVKEKDIKEEIENVLTNIEKSSSNNKLLQILKTRKQAYEELDGLLSNEQRPSVTDQQFKSLLSDLTKDLGISRTKIEKAVFSFKNNDWNKCQRILKNSLTNYHKFIADIKSFIKDGEFEKVDSSIKKCFLIDKDGKDIKDELNKVLNNILDEQKKKVQGYFDKRFSILQKLLPALNSPSDEIDLVQSYKSLFIIFLEAKQ